MNKLQDKLYGLLIEVDELCKKHDVTYYLAAGGALGAIRNGGFLPWDDDVDLYITRDNWEKLVRAMETEKLPSNRDFIHIDNTDLYCNPIGRYVDKDSTLMMNSQMLCGKCCGYLVEFFLMDPMPKGEEAKWEHRKHMKAYTELLSPYFLLNKEIFEHNVDFDFKLYNKYYWISKFLGNKKALALLMDKFARTPEEESDAYCMRWGQRTVIFDKEYFGEPRYVMFEDREFPLVGMPEKTFRVGYGDDWMYVPSVENQIFHDLDSDIDEPFETYTSLYMPLLEKEALWKAYNKKKRAFIKSVTKRESYIRKLAFARAELYVKQIDETSKSADELTVLLENRDFDALNSELALFYSLQAQSTLKANDIIIPMSDEYIYVAVMNLILQGFYYRAARILKYRVKTCRVLSNKLKDAQELISFCRTLSEFIYDDRDISSVERTLASNKQYEYIIDYAKADLWVKSQKAECVEDFEKLVQDAKNAVSVFGNDGELVRFEAYGLHCLGLADKAFEKYNEAIVNTRNGFVWREANELYGLDAYAIKTDGKTDEDQDEEDEVMADE